ncbi:MAG: SMP-30/gluconolactonase/LRE family protein [Planctomycetota bacterium]|jgi:gluconolactonase
MSHRRTRIFFLLVPLGLLVPLLPAQDQEQEPEKQQPKTIHGIGPLGAITKLHTGFGFTEGPAADRDGNCYFTDVRGNRIHKISIDGKLTTFLEDSQGCNGLMFDRKGRLTKKIMPVAASYDGKRFNRPNDITLDVHGGAYFTDPMFGRRRGRTPPQDKQCVYYVDKNGKVTRLIDDLTRPNGTLLSPDGKTLYVLPSGPDTVGLFAYEVKAQGKLGPAKKIFAAERGDGLTVDRKGNLYLTQGSAIVVVSAAGKKLGSIPFPERPSNCTFAGKDFDFLVVTARTSVYVAQMAVKGHVVCLRPKHL